MTERPAHPDAAVCRAADVPLLVVSCDAYSDLWRPFFALFHQRWPDCPFRVYLGTNEKSFDDPHVTVLHCGPDRPWSVNLRRMLDQLGGEYVILLLEDFFLLRPVESDRLLRLVQLGLDHHVGCLRLYSILPPPHPLHHEPGLGGFEPGDPYRVTLQAALWRMQTLRRLLAPGLSPWQFELLGSQLSETFDEPFWGVYEPPIVYEHVIEKGRWKPAGLALCREAGIEIDHAARPAFTEEEWRRHNHIHRLRTRLATLRGETVRAFLAGQRKTGLSLTVNYLCRRPFSLRVWALGLAGLFGPRVFALLRRLAVRVRIAGIGLRYALLPRGKH